MKILLAEDNNLLREMLGCLFQENGDHSVVLAANGREAWELLEKGERFDYIISDYNMPEMTGIELLKMVRANTRTIDVPFVLMSGDRVVSGDDPTPLGEVCTKYGAHFLDKLAIRDVNDLVVKR